MSGVARAGAWLALAVLLPAAVRAGEPATTETVNLPVPWEDGKPLVYATESVDVRISEQGERRIVATDTTTIVTERMPDGTWRQAWTSTQPRIELLAGEEDASVAGMRAAAEAFEGVPLRVRLGSEAGYAGIENLDDITRRMRDAMRPIMIAGIEAGIAGLGPDVAEGDRARVRQEAMARLDQMLDATTAPAVIEAALRRTPETFNAFTGIDAEPGAPYAAQVTLDNPLGSTPFPATLEFTVYHLEGQPGHLLVEWSSAIDPERGLQGVWEAVEAIYGVEVPAEERREMPGEIGISDVGMMVVGPTGLPEMVETERRVRFGKDLEFERQRMRMANADHEHDWAADDAASWVPPESPGAAAADPR